MPSAKIDLSEGQQKPNISKFADTQIFTVPLPDPFLNPIQLAGYELKHRIAMAPMTRFRTLDIGVVNASAAEYYSERATSGGLLISEGLAPDSRGRGFPRTPGIYTNEQVEAWKPITEAVRAKGGVFFAQLWQELQIIL